MTVIYAIIIPAACFLFSVSADMISRRLTASAYKEKTAAEYRYYLFVLVTEWVICAGFYFLTGYLMFCDDSGIPVSVLIITAVLPFTLKRIKKERLKKFVRYITFSAILILTAEIVLFNGKSFTLNDTDTLITADKFIAEGSASYGDHFIVITDDASVILDDIPENTKAIICDMYQERTDNSRRFRVWLEMKDDNFRYEYQTVRSKYTMAYDKNCTFTFEPYGKIHSLKLNFSDITEPVEFNSVRAVSAVPFRFSLVRFFVLFLIFILISAVKAYSLHSIKFRIENTAHKILVYSTAVICTFSVILFFPASSETIRYDPASRTSYGSDIYVRVFDAFQKGQVYLDMEADPELETLENVYDESERIYSEIDYKWDYAYYKGRYYCYFGVAPVLTFYYPFYLITGKLPAIPMAVSFFSLFAVLFLCLAIYAAHRLIVSEPNLLLMLLSMPAAVSCVGVYYVLNYADMYCLPLASGMCFLFICLWAGMTACVTRGKPGKYILFLISGAALALCAASRPGMAVGAVVLLPFYIGILADKNTDISFRIKQAMFFTVPLFIGLAGIFWYNTARFGSPFDFGAEYQMTVSDIHANRLRLSSIPAAFYHFFFQIPRPANTFPFFETQYYVFNNYGSYKYVADAVGALTYPFVTAGIILLPVSVKRYSGNRIGAVAVLKRNSFIVLGFIYVIFTAWVDFCLGGIINRYVVDIMTLSVILSSVIINKNSSKKYVSFLSVMSMAATFCTGWLLALQQRDCALSLRCPELFDAVQEMFIFW